MTHPCIRSLSVQVHNRVNAPCVNKTLTSLSALLCPLRQKWIMEERLNLAQSAQLLMTSHAWFWHSAILSQTTSVTWVCKEEETKQFQKSFEARQWWSSDIVLRLLSGKKTAGASKWEWKNNKWQATQITLSWFYCVGEPSLERLLCHAPWHILFARHGGDFTTCPIFECNWTVCLSFQ